MYNYLKRRKRVLLSTAAAMGAAAAVYYLWPSEEGDSEQNDGQGKQRDEAHEGAAASSQGEQRQPQVEQSGSQGEGSIDDSMTSHFQFIQEVSTPQELEQLLPHVQSAAYQMTDVQVALAALPPGTSAKAKLDVLAQHSLGRALACTWLLPAVDLLVRAKLNIIGRHLFLQERLSQLPLAAAREHYDHHGRSYHQRQEVLPPRISAAAIQAFLPCNHLATTGCQWMVEQVLASVGASLSELDLGAARGPEELVQLLQGLQEQVTSSLPASNTSAGVDWTMLLLGSTDPVPGTGDLSGGPLDPESTGMLVELQQELRAALASPQFQQAMSSAVQHCFRALAMHVVDSFPAADPAANVCTASAGQPAQQEQVCAPSAETGGRSAGAAPSNAGRIDLAGGQRDQRTWWGYLQSWWPLGAAPGGSASTAPSIQTGLGSRASLLAGVPTAVNKPARPTARLLRPVQQAADPLFVDVAELSKSIASLGPVMSLSASIFARDVM